MGLDYVMEPVQTEVPRYTCDFAGCGLVVIPTLNAAGAATWMTANVGDNDGNYVTLMFHNKDHMGQYFRDNYVGK